MSVSGSMATFQPLSSVKKKSATINQDIHGSGDRHRILSRWENIHPDPLFGCQTESPKKVWVLVGENLGPKFSDLWRIQATFSKYHSLLKFHWESRIISLKKRFLFQPKNSKVPTMFPPDFPSSNLPGFVRFLKLIFSETLGGIPLLFHHHLLGGGWTNPSEKYSSNCILSPRIGMKIQKNIKPPPSSKVTNRRVLGRLQICPEDSFPPNLHHGTLHLRHRHWVQAPTGHFGWR